MEFCIVDSLKRYEILKWKYQKQQKVWMGDLNESIRVAINFSLLPRYTEINGTRHVVPSTSSGVPVMWLVPPLSSIHLSLRSWLMSFILCVHAFHGCTEEFKQRWKSHTLIVCLLFLGKRFGVFLR